MESLSMPGIAVITVHPFYINLLKGMVVQHQVKNYSSMECYMGKEGRKDVEAS